MTCPEPHSQWTVEQIPDPVEQIPEDGLVPVILLPHSVVVPK